MSQSSICIVNVVTPEGAKDYVALASADAAFSHGLVSEAILGLLKRPLQRGEPITPEVFVANSAFIKFLAEVVARHGPENPDLQAEAAGLGQGYVAVIDGRTPTPEGPVPPEDIIGVFQVADGKVVPGSYLASPKHKLLTADGFFQLDPVLDACLQQELAGRASMPDKPPPG